MTQYLQFKALVVEETTPGKFTRRIIQRSLDDLPRGEVLVRVQYSSLNYKDGLSATGNKGVTHSYPHVPGIDAAGVVEASEHPAFRPGDEVLAAAGEIGASQAGGYSQYLRVPAAWLIHLPDGLTLRESMAIGTAGFTAALCVDRLQQAGITPEHGDVLVTGATGGVGSMAVGILAAEGYRVTAATGKTGQAALLKNLGAHFVIQRDELLQNGDRPLLHARYAGVVDTVGGKYLSAAVRATLPEGVVTACGNTASADLALTVYPFILRGVSLLGIDATRLRRKDRKRLWAKLGSVWKLPNLNNLVRDVPLEALDSEIEKILQGRQVGRVIVKI
jgi:acrylyl-CoA reductase (NADPH)